VIGGAARKGPQRRRGRPARGLVDVVRGHVLRAAEGAVGLHPWCICASRTTRLRSGAALSCQPSTGADSIAYTSLRLGRPRGAGSGFGTSPSA
jgi:hypothetical protein